MALAQWWPASQWILLDGSERRAVFLHDAVERLGLGDRVSVLHAAAEVAGRDDRQRGRFDLVVVRSFGPPAVVAECGAPFLRPGGRLVVSEPPAFEPSRWPPDGLARFGLELEKRAGSDDASVVVLQQRTEVSADVPRRVGIPARRPRW